MGSVFFWSPYIYIYIYIYIYTPLQNKSIWSHSKIFISRPKSVIFKKKAPQWFYSKYKSSWVTLDKNQKKKKKKAQKLDIWFIKMTPFSGFHCFTDSRHSFHQRLEVDWRLFNPAFLQVLPEASYTCGLFSSDILVKFIPHQFSGI